MISSYRLYSAVIRLSEVWLFRIITLWQVGIFKTWQRNDSGMITNFGVNSFECVPWHLHVLKRTKQNWWSWCSLGFVMQYRLTDRYLWWDTVLGLQELGGRVLVPSPCISLRRIWNTAAWPSGWSGIPVDRCYLMLPLHRGLLLEGVLTEL
jgi:hypothetical protein